MAPNSVSPSDTSRQRMGTSHTVSKARRRTEEAPAAGTPRTPRTPRAPRTTQQDQLIPDRDEPSVGMREPKSVLFSDLGEANGRENFANFGELLIYLRTSYGERMHLSELGKPHVTITAQSVALSLKELGYSMTSGSYSLLEQGKTLPKNPDAFLQAVAKSLSVEKTSKYWALLRYQYVFDHMVKHVDREFAVEHFPHGQRALDLLLKKQL